jgi:tRNA (mo5U34)-methyltransferase
VLKISNKVRKKWTRIPYWYHKIDLGDGIITPGENYGDIWDNIRKTRDLINYKDKNVLDIASYDGMWAFEAEKLGATTVIATDIYYNALKKFLLCREILKSNVIPFYNISPYNLYERLEVFLKEDLFGEDPLKNKIDIIQHFGVLYHLRDPLYSLSQARSIISDDGYLIIETAAILNEDRPFMAYNCFDLGKGKVYDDFTTWWAPTIPCLKEMLRTSLFEVDNSSINVMTQFKTDTFLIGRIVLIARPLVTTTKQIDKDLLDELKRTFRNPGLVFRDSTGGTI